MKQYKHIQKTERLEISILLNKGYSQNSIAGVLGRSKGTISEEIKNNSVNGKYDPNKAQHKSYVKRLNSKYQGMKIEKNIKLRNYVDSRLGQDWSPEQIAGRIKEQEKNIKYTSKMGIYKYIYSPYGRNLEKHLRRKGKKGKQRINSGSIKNRTFIEERPLEANNRLEYGHWEGDLIVSGKQGKGVLLTLHERKSRYPIIEKISSRKTKIINQRIYERTGIFINFDSLTLDNDVSFSKHEELSSLLNCPIYFCHPYHSWEKGGVENTNGLIRQYIKKGSDISKYSVKYIREIERKLQNRPRKCLNFKTPKEVMVENNQLKVFDLNILKVKINKNNPSVRVEG